MSNTTCSRQECSVPVKNAFLKHVEGLRGLAILMIVLFHYLPEYFPQGFVGVEVFLVISGYLLFRSWKEGQKFPLLTFVKKRVVRIYPLLCTLVIFCCVAAPFVLCPLRQLGNSSLMSLFGVSNFWYAKRYADYFAAAPNMNPLLHTWYLSVILQVYVLWAVVAVIVGKLSRRVRVALIVSIAVVSFLYDYSIVINQWVKELGFNGWQQLQDISYYNTGTRLWQVLAGGLVLVLPACKSRWANNFLALVGAFALLLTAFSGVDVGSCESVLAVVSTVLLMTYIPCSSFRCVLENRVLTSLGAISFSLYVVHFPIVVFYKYWERELPTVSVAVVLFFVALGVAALMWYGVEKRTFSLRVIALFLLASITSGFVIRLYNRKLCPCSFKFSYPVYHDVFTDCPKEVYMGMGDMLSEIESGTELLALNAVERNSKLCMPLGGGTPFPEFVLLGDSNAQHLYFGMHELCKKKCLSGVHLSTTVIPLWNRGVFYNSAYNWSEQKAHELLHWLEAHPYIHTVVISQIWTRRLIKSKTDWHGNDVLASFADNAELLKEFCEKMKDTGKRVVLVTPSPEMLHMSKDIHGEGLEYARWLEWRNKLQQPLPAPFVLRKDEHFEYHKETLALFDEMEQVGLCKVLHIEKGIFRHGDFLGIRNGVLYVRDATHVTPPASIDIMDAVADDFVRLIEEGRRANAASEK